jgi:hypothetical protein
MVLRFLHTKWQAQYFIENDLLGKGTIIKMKLYAQLTTKTSKFNVSGGSKSKYYVSTGFQNDQGLMLKKPI